MMMMMMIVVMMMIGLIMMHKRKVKMVMMMMVMAKTVVFNSLDYLLSMRLISVIAIVLDFSSATNNLRTIFSFSLKMVKIKDVIALWQYTKWQPGT